MLCIGYGKVNTLKKSNRAHLIAVFGMLLYTIILVMFVQIKYGLADFIGQLIPLLINNFLREMLNVNSSPLQL